MSSANASASSKFVAVGGEDDVGVARREVAPLGGIAGLEDHGMALRAARQDGSAPA
jgi:hypothetical protein